MDAVCLHGHGAWYGAGMDAVCLHGHGTRYGAGMDAVCLGCGLMSKGHDLLSPAGAGVLRCVKLHTFIIIIIISSSSSSSSSSTTTTTTIHTFPLSYIRCKTQNTLNIMITYDK